MPRPKRTKLASTRVEQQPQPTKSAPGCRKPAKNLPAQIEPTSDDSDGLITNTKRTRRQMAWHLKPEKDADLTMTGALPEGDKGVRNEKKTAQGARNISKAKEPNSKQNNALEALKKRRDAALLAKQAQSEPPPAAVDESRPARPASPGPSHENSIDDRTPPNEDLGDTNFSSSPVVGTRPPSALKAHGTPALETSILALANFKRRPRQPSILRMVQQDTDNEDEDLTFSDLDDFNPDDESTPLKLQKSGAAETPAAGTTTLTTSSSRHTSGSRKRKLSPPEVQVPRSSPPPVVTSADSHADNAIPSPAPRSASPNPSEAESENFFPSREPDVMSETMAPPRSSSPVAIGDSLAEARDSRAPAGARQPRAGRPLRNQNVTGAGDEVASDLEGESRGRIAKKSSKKFSKATAMSTAKLQSLLPQRRRQTRTKTHDQFDIPSSDDIDTSLLESDEDELGLTNKNKIRTVRKDAKTPAKKSRGAARKSATTTSTKKGKKTYGNRRISSDKENDSAFTRQESSDDDDEPTEISTEQVHSAELKAAAKKFEEVDEWEMEFESVDIGGESSSPWR